MAPAATYRPTPEMMKSELDMSRERLAYYTALKQQKGATRKSQIFDKWIEIYSERVQKLERQMHRIGLKTKIPATGARGAVSASA